MDQKSILDGIDSPKDLKRLPFSQLPLLAEEIRKLLIQTASENGGHLASNLGAVEITLALHRVFDSPTDQIVWDVGHQSYTHKILTGRRERFPTIRTGGGLSGYPKITESEHDIFIAGHSSTSISAALGLAQAKTLRGEPGQVIAVIGDGAFTNGMIYEALNNAAVGGNRLIVLLNDNEMSISKNVGELARYLAEIRTSPRYFHAKDTVEAALKRIPLIGKPLRKVMLHYKAILRQSLYKSNLFENFGFSYLGPVDGHNLQQLCDVLERAKKIMHPVLLHVETVKGKGYSYAEEKPDKYHGISRFNIETGDPDSGMDNYSSVFGNYLIKLAEQDKRICAITAAMEQGTGLSGFARKFRKEGRFFDVGIAEEHAVTFAAGLAANGILPVFALYSTFAQRVVDQILHDVAIDNRHVVFCLDRAGIVGDDGETHQGTFDVSLFSAVPHVTIYSPSSFQDLENSLYRALYQEKGPCIVRYPRGSQCREIAPLLVNGADWQILGEKEAPLLLVTYGRELEEAWKAFLSLREKGIPLAILKLGKIAPLLEDAQKQILKYPAVLFAEEGIRRGGIGEQTASLLDEWEYKGMYRIAAIEDCYVRQNTIPEALKEVKLDSGSLAEQLEKLFYIWKGKKGENSG